MCLAVPGKLISIDETDRSSGVVEMEGVRCKVSLALVSDSGESESVIKTESPIRTAEIGDWVLVHVGFALSVIDDAEAQETLRLLRSLDTGLQDEIDQIAAGGIS